MSLSFLDLKETDNIPLWLCVHQVGRLKAMLIQDGAEDVMFTVSPRNELEARVTYKKTMPTFRTDKPEALRQVLNSFKHWRAQRG